MKIRFVSTDESIILRREDAEKIFEVLHAASEVVRRHRVRFCGDKDCSICGLGAKLDRVG